MARQETPLSLHGFDLGDHFVDLRPLGVGVTGLVLSAEDRRTGQRVAIKKLAMRDAVTVKHALREVKITRRLRHENVVRVHEVLAPYGQPLPRDPAQLSALYIIQECMETDLARLLEQGPLNTGTGSKIKQRKQPVWSFAKFGGSLFSYNLRSENHSSGMFPDINVLEQVTLLCCSTSC